MEYNKRKNEGKKNITELFKPNILFFMFFSLPFASFNPSVALFLVASQIKLS